MSPEQGLDSAAVDIRSDIYSLGATLYFLLTGRGPFEGEPLAQKMLGHQVREPMSIHSVRTEVPNKLAEVVARMMAKNSADRYSAPSDVIAALAPWTAEPLPPPPDAEMPRLRPSAYRLGLSNVAQAAGWSSDSQFTPAPVELASDTPWVAEE